MVRLNVLAFRIRRAVAGVFGLVGLVTVGASAVAPGMAMAESITPASGVFYTTKQWYQLSGDSRDGVYRAYAVFIADGKIVDLPNLLIMNCSRKQTYLTVHFPKNYVFSGFDSTTWIPKTDVAMRTESSTYNYKAELNNNEFYIDLSGDELDQIQDIWRNSTSVEMRLGPQYSPISLTLTNAELDQQTMQMVSENLKERTVSAHYTPLEMQTRCLADQIRGRNAEKWEVFGSIECVTCSGKEGKTYSHIEVSSKSGNKPIRTREECESVRKSYEASLQSVSGNGEMKADLLCLTLD